MIGIKEEFLSNSEKETEKIAANFAKKLSGGEVIAYTGNLGAGKTCFTRGLARGLGFKGDVSSPTFALVNEYRGGRLDLFHFDMYRISGFEDLYSTGFFDYLSENGVVAVEWSENISGILDEKTIFIDIRQPQSPNSRIITIKSEDII